MKSKLPPIPLPVAHSKSATASRDAATTLELELNRLDAVLEEDRSEELLRHGWFGDEPSEAAVEEFASRRARLVQASAVAVGAVLAALALVTVGLG